LKPTAVLDTTIDSNLPGEVIRMQIDPEATAHLMGVLTDLYSDRIMAVIREYSTNARDAHLEAGQTRPIEITLPNTLSPTFKVKDYGIGLDVDAMRRIYSQYGTSTKRGSDDFNGMLGLGCKSAMTYTSQFSITSVKDGTKYAVAVSRAEDGVGEMTVVSITDTDEPNGVEVSIPVKRDDTFAFIGKTNEFFKWWDEGTVTVNGKRPERFKGRKVKDNLYIVDNLPDDVIVMGGVAYPVPGEGGLYNQGQDRWGYNRKQFAVVYFANMGEVTFAPSRESLQDNKNTRHTVERVRSEFVKHVITGLQAELDACKTHFDAWTEWVSMKERYSTLDLSALHYKGDQFISDVRCPTEQVEVSRALKIEKVNRPIPFVMYTPYERSTPSRREGLTAHELVNWRDRVTFITGGPRELTATNRTKLRRMREDDLVQGTVIITTEDTVPGLPWNTGVKVMKWSAVSEYRLNAGGNSISDRTKHDVHELDGKRSNRAVPDAEKIVYTSPTTFSERNWNSLNVNNYVSRAREAGYTFMLLNANRHDKFQREHPNALSLDKFCQQAINKFNDSLTATDKRVCGLDSDEFALLSLLNEVDIDDPDVVQWVRNVKSTDKRRRELIDKRRLLEYNESRVSSARVASFDDGATAFEKYPLVTSSIRASKKNAHHVTAYINAIYNG
jgi:hypothetical protein